MFIELLDAIIKFGTADLGSNLFDKTKVLITELTPLIKAALGTYFLLVAIEYQRSGIQESMIDMSKKFLGWILLSAIALNSTYYVEIAKAIYSTPDGLATLIGGDKKIDGSMLTAMQNQVNLISAKIDSFEKTFDWYYFNVKLAAFFTKFVINICMMVIGTLTVVFYVLAKINLAMILLIGPVFLGAMFFPATRQYGMNWIGQCLNYIISVGLYVSATIILFGFVDVQVAKMFGSPQIFGATQLIAICLYMLALTILFLLVLLSVPSIASALTGGAGLSTNVGKVMSLARAGNSLLRGKGKTNSISNQS